MHLSKILEELKRLSYTGEDDSIEMHEELHGPHFDEAYAKKAVKKMENEDGSKGPHWTVEETTSVANQMGINLKSEKHNKWDWYVAMNMVYSDFYKAVVAMTGNTNSKHFAELAKAWLCDKDVSEGKMWNYFVNIMCDEEKEEKTRMKRSRGYGKYEDDDDEYEERERYGSRRGYRDDYQDREREYGMRDAERMRRSAREYNTRNTSVRYF